VTGLRHATAPGNPEAAGTGVIADGPVLGEDGDEPDPAVIEPDPHFDSKF
jgi:hypothetical protein